MRLLIERLFKLDKDATNSWLRREKTLLNSKHWTEIVDILSYFRKKFGDNHVVKMIQRDEILFRTSSTLKYNLKKNGINISYIKGILNTSLISFF